MLQPRTFNIVEHQHHLAIEFYAMASPCSALVDSKDHALAQNIATIVCEEVWRIEDKFSRYQPQSLCSAINRSNGVAVAIDNETFLLLNFAHQCYELSDGLFDITAGVLRKVWHFDTSDNIPNAEQVAKVLPNIGWEEVHYDQHSITLPPLMEIDFGGIGKEYAVDRAILLAKRFSNVEILVNLGGDLCASGPRQNDKAWQVGVEGCDKDNQQPVILSMYQGALATSGDTQRYLLCNGKRYSHILNPKTGWPIKQAPASVTVAASHCVEAGMLATLSLLQGKRAKAFLESMEVEHWLID